jgi:hypothetical protein
MLLDFEGSFPSLASLDTTPPRGASPIKSDLVTLAGEHMAIKRVVADVGLRPRKPPDFNLSFGSAVVLIVEFIPRLPPVESRGNVAPELHLNGINNSQLFS